MYSFLKKLESEYGAEVTELKHGYRINGVVDVYKNGVTIYDIINNKYHRLDEKERLQFCIDKINNEEKRPPFKKLIGGGISYQQFKHDINKIKSDPNSNGDADRLWSKNFAIVSEDHLYFMVCEGKVKIGRSKDVNARIKTLQTGIAGKIFCFVFRNKGFLEIEMHKCFKEQRLRGEWFKYDEFIKRFVARINTKENAFRIVS